MRDYTHTIAAFDPRTGKLIVDLEGLGKRDPRLALLAKDPWQGYDEASHSIRLQAADGTIYAVDPTLAVSEAPAGSPDSGEAACSWAEEPQPGHPSAPAHARRTSASQ